MGAEINKLLIIIFASAAIVVGAGIMTADDETHHWTQQKPVSLPEEIYLAEKGDTLVVSKVADSIYIQFK